MDMVFKALADPARRTLLDALRDTDGQTLQQLQGLLEMTRFGVMKHLGVLEDAGLVVTRKKGRFKHHYLNALPLQEAIDRWIEPYRAKPVARAVLDLKSQLEGTAAMLDKTPKPDFMMQTYIRCTQDALWEALTDPAQMSAYHFLSPKVTQESELYTYHTPDGGTMLVERRLKTDPKTRIENSFEPKWAPDIPASRSVFLLQPEEGHVRLTIEHYDLSMPVVPGEGVADGWQRWAAGLKTYLETGAPTRFSQGGTM